MKHIVLTMTAFETRAVCWARVLLVAALAGIARADDTPASSSDRVVQDGRLADAMTAEPTGTRPEGTSVRSYSVRFQLNEDPHLGGEKVDQRRNMDGTDWYNVITRSGVAYGAVSQGDYTDPTTSLTGTWGTNQTARAKVFSRNQTEEYYQEVEIRLRSTLARHRGTRYEVFWRCLKTQNAYVEIVSLTTTSSSATKARTSSG